MKWTRALLIATPIIWVAWDLIVFLWVGGNPATESANIFRYGYTFPQLPLAWGYLTGHFFAQKRLPSTVALPGGGPFWESLGPNIAIAIPIVWFAFDLKLGGSWLTRLVSSCPGPGHGAIEMVIIGTAIAYFSFQMKLATEE